MLNGVIEILDIKDFYECNNIWDMEKQKSLADQFYQEIIDNNRITFIYKIDGEFIGEVSLVFDKKDPDYTIKNKRIYVSRFLVKDGYRSQGIGTIMMDYIIKYAEGLGYKEMSVGVDLDNYRAIKFYVKNGFNNITFIGEDEFSKYMKLLRKE